MWLDGPRGMGEIPEVKGEFCSRNDALQRAFFKYNSGACATVTTSLLNHSLEPLFPDKHATCG
jgi:hypothetical protein